MKYFLDTSIIIDYLKDKTGIVPMINDLDGDLASGFVCLAELYEGVFRATKNNEQIKKGVEDFFAGLDEVYGLDKNISREFGQIRAKLKRSGNIIEDLDILIAATCISKHLTLVTQNKSHFKRIPDLQIRDF